MRSQRIYLPQTTLEAGLERIEWIFREFSQVYVNLSGGKDSTVILNLSLEVAERLGRLPLKVMFIDQEAEWQCVIDYIRQVMHDPRVEPYWLQVPIQLFNATSHRTQWLMCWEEGAKWIRPKEPDSLHENVYGTLRFKKLFSAFAAYHHPHEPVAQIGGVRCEENPSRFIGLTGNETYKGKTWGKTDSKARGHYTWYPIYDWSHVDVWAAIHRQRWAYCALYDYQYQYGLPICSMRVSNLHHETSVESLLYLQETEADTWERLTRRLHGVNTVGQLQKAFLQIPQLPYMFASWEEYRDYLCVHLIPEPAHQEAFRRHFARMDVDYPSGPLRQQALRAQISALLVNDWHSTKLHNFCVRHAPARRLALLAQRQQARHDAILAQRGAP